MIKIILGFKDIRNKFLVNLVVYSMKLNLKEQIKIKIKIKNALLIKFKNIKFIIGHRLEIFRKQWYMPLKSKINKTWKKNFNSK